MKNNLIIILLIINTLLLSVICWSIFYSRPKYEKQCLNIAQNFENMRLNDKDYNQSTIDHLSLFMKNYLHCISDR